MGPGQIVLFVFGTVIVIFAAYYTTYILSVSSARSRRQAGKSIILRDRFAIAKDKSFCLVEVKGRVYVVGVTNNNMTLLDTIDAEEFAAEDLERGSQGLLYGAVPSGVPAVITAAINRIRADFTLGSKRGEKGSFSEAFKAARENSADNRQTEDKPEEQEQDSAKR